MPEWLRESGVLEVPIPVSTMAARLAIAAGFGVVIALIYRLSHGRLARESHILMGTLVLLTILLAMVTMVIGESVARAFGLVGALSIVRFRTIVEDTRDTAFVIFAVVVGMAIGTGLVLVAAVGVPIVALAAVALSVRLRGGAASRGSALNAMGPLAETLTVRLGLGHSPSTIESILSLRCRRGGWRLAGVTTARQGTAVDLTYTLDLAPEEGGLATAGPALVMELNSLEGVQSVDLQSGVEAEPKGGRGGRLP